MAEEKRENAPAKEKKPSAYDVPFGNQKDVTKSGTLRTTTSSKSVPRRAPAAVKTMRNASDAPEKEKTEGSEKKNDVHRKSATTAAPAKAHERVAKEGRQDTKPHSMRPAHRAMPYVLFALALFIGLTLVLNLFCNLGNKLSEHPSEHWMGIVGYGVSYVLNALFGPAVLFLPILLVILGIYWRRYVDHGIAISKIIASFIFLVTLGAVIHIFNMIVEPALRAGLPASQLLAYGAQSLGGGLLGGGFGFALYSLCRFVGALIIAFLLLALSLFYLLGMTPQHAWNYLSNRRKSRPKHNRSLSEEDAEQAGNRAKMEQKIRRTTTRQMEIDDDFEAEAPVGAVRVVSQQKKSAEDKIAPMPMPRLDPNDGNNLFVPEAVSEKMARAEEEETVANEMATRQAAQSAAILNARRAPTQPTVPPAMPQQPAPTPPPAASVEPIDPAANRDAAVEPIFPRSAEGRIVRRIPRADRSFDLKTIFTEPSEPSTTTGAPIKHAPVPPEVPLAPRRTATPSGTPVPKPTVPARSSTAPATASVGGTIRTPAASGMQATRPTASPNTASTPQKPLSKSPTVTSPTAKQATPQKRDFGLTNEEFERLEAQQISIPRPNVKKPVAATPVTPKNVEKPTVGTPAAKATKPKHYIFPPISYLHEAEKMSAENLAEIQSNMDALAMMLKSFHIAIDDNIGYSCGPTVTRYEITPAPGVRVRSITNLSDDIALALRAPGKIRIEAPIPGTNAVGIEVPNRSRSTIYLRELLESKPFKESKNKLTACLGAGVAGEPLVFEINKMPHLLVAGTTNSGKSVCINSIIMSLLYRLRPDEVKFVMIDPKKVEFTSYQNIPHLMAPVVTAPADAAGALQACVEEMERRYELFAQVGVRDIKGFTTATESDPDMPHLPFIVIIIDELADLMMTARDEVETAICRIAQKARAAGMHLIIGTQRPSADVVTGLIKSNVPSRIAFTVKSQVDSRVILDGIGAEALTGMGDMLFVPVGAMRNERVQGTFVSDKEVEKICEFIRATNGTAEYDANFIAKLKELASQCGNKGKNSGGGELASAGDVGEKGDDPKYSDAVRIAIEEKRISTSLLQRKLEIGYSRAAKLIDRMQAEGYVSPPDGSKPRSVLITPEQYMEKFVDDPSNAAE